MADIVEKLRNCEATGIAGLFRSPCSQASDCFGKWFRIEACRIRDGCSGHVEVCADEGETSGNQHRCSDSLHAARDDQLIRVLCDSAEYGRNAEN